MKMTSKQIATIVVLTAMLACNFGWAQEEFDQTITDCQKLPKATPPGINDFAASNPYYFTWVLSTSLDCTARVYVPPVRPYTNYSGVAFDIRGSGIVVIDFVVGSDGQTAYLTYCHTGAQETWNFQYVDLNDTLGANYCAYKCNGSSIAEYKCTSNTGVITPRQELAVNQAKRVQNGNNIHKGWANCPPNNFCPMFY